MFLRQAQQFIHILGPDHAGIVDHQHLAAQLRLLLRTDLQFRNGEGIREAILLQLLHRRGGGCDRDNAAPCLFQPALQFLQECRLANACGARDVKHQVS